ncbi:phosphoglycerate mutase-like protein [Dentipellis sp. KUC8613]|nr:phosphoglycerate mutase-like protein [Dentipellis sp. KUC8613]
MIRGIWLALSALPFVASAVVQDILQDQHPAKGSSWAGSTTAFTFPPANVTATIPDPNFPDATQIHAFGPTATGDEAASIETAPSIAKVDSIFPLIRPGSRKSSDFEVLRHLGSLTPMVSNDADTFGLPYASPVIPDGCKLKQAYLLHRHGARYPPNGTEPGGFASRLHAAATGAGFSATGPLSFLNEWTYKLGAEILTPFGRKQLYDLGVGFRVSYGDLLKGFVDLPVFRTNSQERMVDSALQFAAGFFGVQSYQTSYHQQIDINTYGFNSTLAPFQNCTNAFSKVAPDARRRTTEWASIYTQPIIERLSKHIKGVNLTSDDVVAMQQACAFETVALGYSSFCGLFTKKEWKEFEYHDALLFWYVFGPGGPATAAQGVGWVQELLSRLTRTRITNFDSSINSTLASSNITFPLNQPIYVDATHDVVISSILVAMNFTSLAASGPLPSTHIPENQSWKISQIVPFATRLVGQVLSCHDSDEPTHIRFMLNDAVLPMTGLKGCKANKHGLCAFDNFIAGMQARVDEIDYQFDCFANYTIPEQDMIIDGRFPQHLRQA